MDYTSSRLGCMVGYMMSYMSSLLGSMVSFMSSRCVVGYMSSLLGSIVAWAVSVGLYEQSLGLNGLSLLINHLAFTWAIYFLCSISLLNII